ncbi:hypothetical protein BBJ28_00006855 [Nothophytophthora sp. Chile5]|nr:hypothetical protein BBJ28_00006855 [Nothophytophthora sp. Chile5]
MATPSKTVLITGSTRGIGLAFAKHYTQAGWNVIATARANSNTEEVRSPIHTRHACHGLVVTMDTSDEATVVEAARQLEGVAIDLLVNNAGIGLPGNLHSFSKASLMREFEVNSVGPLLVTRALLPNLQLAAKTHGSAFVVQLSSFLGSITSYTSETAAIFGGNYGYSASKAALNMVTRALAVDLQTSGVGVVAMHPGYVDTDMTQGKATLQPADSVAAMAKTVANLKIEDTGKFFNLDSNIPVSEIPW